QRAEDGVYANWHVKNKTSPDISDGTDKRTTKIVISAIGFLLILGVLLTLCAIGVLYHNKVVSYEIISEKYDKVTATLILQMSKANETEMLYEALKRNFQQVQKELSVCNTNQNSRECKEGWKSHGLKCYYFSTEKLNWAQSRDHCVVKGGHLVIITSQPEQNFASSQMEESHWIGLNDLETEGKWMWVNNQPLTESSV
ncbi:C-type lectin domain family 6 member A-like, partial [Clarias magur]